MKDLVRLENGDSWVEIDPQGAWITEFVTAQGDVFYPRRLISASDGSQKLRGGCHVCLPNFGPGGESGLTQHGFGRTSLWNIENQTENSVTFSLRGGGVGYEGLESRLIYELHDQVVWMTLHAYNSGTEQLAIAPGFHPYFAVHGESELRVDGVSYEPHLLEPAVFIKGEVGQVIVGKSAYKISSTGMTQWALWSDRPAEYICVEPTSAGCSFADDEPAMLQRGETRSWQFVLAQESPAV